MSHPRLAVFARKAKGQVAPLRILEGQQTALSRSSHGVFLDAVNDEIVAPSPLAAAVVVYGRRQHGNTPPVRKIQGGLTRLDSPQGVAVDNTNHELVVSNDGRLSILVFNRVADGNVAPLREIFGSNTLITTPEGIVVDPVHNEIILADEGDPEASPVIPPKLLVFDRTANGNVAPKRVITGPTTGLIRPRQLQLDTERDELVLADRGLPQEFIYAPATQGYIGFWDRTASGDTPPKRIIRGPRSQLSSPRAVHVDMVRAQAAGTDPPAKRERHAVHLTDALRANDPKLAETFDGAADSLRAGHEVVILFDGRSVTALRMNQKKAKKAPLEELGLGPEEQSTWAERLGLPAVQAPRSHFELVQRLAGAGAKVFVNRNAVKLYGLSDEEIHPIATPISAREMGKLLDETGLCYTYGH